MKAFNAHLPDWPSWESHYIIMWNSMLRSLFFSPLCTIQHYVKKTTEWIPVLIHKQHTACQGSMAQSLGVNRHPFLLRRKLLYHRNITRSMNNCCPFGVISERFTQGPNMFLAVPFKSHLVWWRTSFWKAAQGRMNRYFHYLTKSEVQD